VRASGPTAAEAEAPAECIPDILLPAASLESSARQKSASGLLHLGEKHEYAVEGRVQHDKVVSLTAPFRLTPTFSLRTPKGKVASLKGSADFRPQRSLKADVTLELPRLFKKSIRMASEFRRQPLSPFNSLASLPE